MVDMTDTIWGQRKMHPSSSNREGEDEAWGHHPGPMLLFYNQCNAYHISTHQSSHGVIRYLHSGWPTAEPSSQPMAAAALQDVSTTCHGQGRPHSRWYSLHAHFSSPALPCSKESRESEAVSMLRAWFLQYNQI